MPDLIHVSEDLTALGFVSALVFVVCMFRWIIGSYKLERELGKRGIRAPYSWQGLVEVWYLFHRPKQDAEELDRLAYSTLVSGILVIVAGFLMYWEFEHLH